MKKFPFNPESNRKKNPLTFLGRVAVGLWSTSLVAGMVFGSTDTGKEFAQHSIEHVVPSTNFSSETTEYVLQDGDGLYAAVKNIEGIDTIDARIAIDYVEQLNNIKPGQTLIKGQSIKIPVSVS